MGFTLKKEEDYSVEVYLEWEAKSQKKYEYFFAEIVAIAGRSVNPLSKNH